MSVVLILGRLKQEDFEEAKEEYKTYIKITIDIVKKLVAIGGEYHADGEKILLEHGAEQKDIWGGGVNLETGEFETNAVINIRSEDNPSLEILNPEIRDRFIYLAGECLKGYV